MVFSVAALSVAVQLRGRYIAYETQNFGNVEDLWIVDSLTGRSNVDSFAAPSTALTGPFVLSPSGVAAWIPSGGFVSGGGATLESSVIALTLTATKTLDQYRGLGTPPLVHQGLGTSPFSNLQLYDCAAGCAPNTTIVAWTYNGAQRYAKVRR